MRLPVGDDLRWPHLGTQLRRALRHPVPLLQLLLKLADALRIETVQTDGQVPSVPGKVRVGREDRRVVMVGRGADQHVDVGTGNPVGSAEVEEPRCQNVVAWNGLEATEGRELLVESLEDFVAADAREYLLAYRSGQCGSPGGDEVSPMVDEPPLLGRELMSTPPQGKRPDCRIDEDGHRGLRSRSRLES